MRPTINLVREKNPKDVKQRRDFSFNDNNGWPLKYENYRPEASPRSNCLYIEFIYLRQVRYRELTLKRWLSILCVNENAIYEA